MVSRGFIIGNGSSRKGFNLSDLVGLGEVYGCNALYRDFKPDLLFTHDSLMLSEIKDGYDGVYVYVDGGLARIYSSNANKPDKILPISTYLLMTGACATEFMCKHTNVSEIFLLGFDLYKIDGRYRSNIYDGTKNYPEKKEIKERLNSITRNLSDMSRVFLENRDKVFYRVGDDLHIPDSWSSYTNVKPICYNRFKELLNWFLWGEEMCLV